MSFTALQSATIITAHCGFTKLLVSFTYRILNFMGPKIGVKQETIENFNTNKHVVEFRNAINNESEFCAFLVSPLLYLASVEGKNTADPTLSLGATLIVYGQCGYVWTRTLLGYPTIGTIASALLRYVGMTIVTKELWNVAFPKNNKAIK